MLGVGEGYKGRPRTDSTRGLLSHSSSTEDEAEVENCRPRNASTISRRLTCCRRDIPKLSD